MEISSFNIVPYVGVGVFKLLSTFESIVEMLDSEQIKYEIETWPNEDCTPPVAWTIIHVEDMINLFFAKGRMFKIYIDGEQFCGELPNRIKIGMPIEKAKFIDSTLKYDDWNEDWSSKNGYWIEDNIDSDTVMSITVFIKEILDDKTFEKYEW